MDEVLGHFEEGDILLLQNEINEVDYLIEKGKEKGMTVAFNPSPFDDYVRKCELTKVDLFFVNEVEGEQITGEKLPENIIACMREQFPEAEIVLTLGDADRKCDHSGEQRRRKQRKKREHCSACSPGGSSGYYCGRRYLYRIFSCSCHRGTKQETGIGKGGYGIGNGSCQKGGVHFYSMEGRSRSKNRE